MTSPRAPERSASDRLIRQQEVSHGLNPPVSLCVARPTRRRIRGSGGLDHAGRRSGREYRDHAEAKASDALPRHLLIVSMKEAGLSTGFLA
jgi:hypothetical protein